MKKTKSVSINIIEIKENYKKLLNEWVCKIIKGEKIEHELFIIAKQNPGIDILGEYYENLINATEREKLGQIFTPDYIIDYINNNTVVKQREKGIEYPNTIDPACGSGRFLIDLVKKGFVKNLYGVDIDPVCVLMTVLNMWFMQPEEVTISWGNFLIDNDELARSLGLKGGAWRTFKIKRDIIEVCW